MQLKKTVPIIYNGGAYGTFLEWALRTLSTQIPVRSPLTPIGNSHNTQTGTQCTNMNEWRTYVKNGRNDPTVRLHPKTLKHESVSQNIEEILDTCQKAILIYPDLGSELLCMNNYITKIYPGQNIYKGALRDIDMAEIYDNFPVSRSNPIPPWIVREHLSFWLVPAWRAQVDWFLPDHWSHERCITIFVNELLFDFNHVMHRIQKFCDIEFVKELDELRPIHDKMIGLQAHIAQDSLCQAIINSVLSHEDEMVWPSLPLASESWIQWKLRELGYEIRCHGLDIFPSDSKTLKSLMYQPSRL